MRGGMMGSGALRLVLALAVVLSHVTFFETGRLAVMLFFVLSGFWVTALWERTGAQGRPGLFLLNRLLRVWPLYAAVLALALAAGLPGAPWRFLLLGTASAKAGAPLGVEWSLDIELQFYLLLPLLSWLAARGGRAGFALATGTLTLAGWALAQATGAVTALAYLPAFAAGIVIRRAAIAPSPRVARASVMAFLAVTAAGFLWWPGLIAEHADADRLGFENDLFPMLWAMPLLPFVAASCHAASSARDRWLGDFSYPLYLAHAPALTLLAGMFDWRSAAGMLVALPVAAGAAVAAWALIDRPAERLRRWVLARVPSGPTRKRPPLPRAARSCRTPAPPRPAARSAS